LAQGPHPIPCLAVVMQRAAASSPQRPRTAPCRVSAECWTEVDTLVRDLLSSAASSASAGGGVLQGLPRRPHTACACAQPLAVVVPEDSEEESDGGSFDEEERDERPPSLAATLRTLGSASTAAGSATLLLRPSEAVASPSAAPPTEPDDLRKPSRAAPAPLHELPEPLSREERLLLGAGLCGGGAASFRAFAARPVTGVPPAEGQKAPATNAKEAKASAAASAVGSAAKAGVPVIKAGLLPKHCLFLGGGRGSSSAASSSTPAAAGPARGAAPVGPASAVSCLRPAGEAARTSRPGTAAGAGTCLTPSAARFRSHNSWLSFRPVRQQQGSESTAVATGATRSGAASSSSAGATADASTVPSIVAAAGAAGAAKAAAVAAAAKAAAGGAAGASAAGTGTAAAAAAPSPPPTGKDLPSRDELPKRRKPKYCVMPGGSRPAKKAASGPGQEFLVVEFRTEPRVVPASRKPGQESKLGRGGALRHQFRPNSRQWATERQALAAAAVAAAR